MNRDRIRTLTQLYRNHYEDWEKSGENPWKRWEAAAVCATEFDLTAGDFGEMLGRALKEAGPVLETGQSRPVEGLLFLCSQGKEEELREAMESLLAPDGGSLEHRWQQVLDFEDACGRLLQETGSAHWELFWERGNALNLLALLRPETDFFFRAPEVTAFAGYTEAEEEIGYDRLFRISAYYKNMEELAEILNGDAELMKLLRKKRSACEKEHGTSGLEEADPRGHLLAYDLVRAVYAMNWYEEKAAKRKSRISTVAQRKIERMEKAAGLLEEREEAQEQLQSAREAAASLALPRLEGARVQHKSFGEGTVALQDGKYLTIDFDKGIQKKFALPGAIAQGFLVVKDREELARECLAAATAKEQVETAQKKREALDVQIRMLMSL